MRKDKRTYGELHQKIQNLLDSVEEWEQQEKDKVKELEGGPVENVATEAYHKGYQDCYQEIAIELKQILS